MGITWSSRAHVFPQLDDAGSTRTMIHRRTREKRTICIQVKKVSRANSASFENKTYRNSTELSKHIWSLKDNNIEHEITWQIVCRTKPYSSSTKRWNLCLSEKFVIICEPERCTLNKRNELVSSCRHRMKVLQQNNQLST